MRITMEKRKAMVGAIMERLCELSAYKGGSGVAAAVEQGVMNSLSNAELDALHTMVVMGTGRVAQKLAERTKNKKQYAPRVKWRSLPSGTLVIDNALCGKCGNVLFGTDEAVCPSCGAFNDWDKVEVSKKV